MKTQKTVLVTGAGGFIGSRISDAFRCEPGFGVIALAGKKDVDLTNAEDLRTCLASVRPDIIVNTAAVSVMSACESDPAYARRLNTDAAGIMAQWCADNGSRLVQLSTDTVFSGNEKVFHREEDEVSPPNVYGRTKAEAEMIIKELCPDHAIVRVVLVYGVPGTGQHGNFVNTVIDKLSSGQIIRAVTDQWRTPTFVSDIARAVIDLSCLDESGIWHVCGEECYSIYELALEVARMCGLDSSLVHPISTEEQDCGFARPKYGMLDITKARKTIRYAPTSLNEALKTMTAFLSP